MSRTSRLGAGLNVSPQKAQVGRGRRRGAAPLCVRSSHESFARSQTSPEEPTSSGSFRSFPAGGTRGDSRNTRRYPQDRVPERSHRGPLRAHRQEAVYQTARAVTARARVRRSGELAGRALGRDPRDARRGGVRARGARREVERRRRASPETTRRRRRRSIRRGGAGVPGVPVRGPDTRRRVRSRAGNASDAHSASVQPPRHAEVRGARGGARGGGPTASGRSLPRRQRSSARTSRAPDVPGGRRRERRADVVGVVRAGVRRRHSANRGRRRRARRVFLSASRKEKKPKRARVTRGARFSSPGVGAAVGPAGDARRAGARRADGAVRVPQRERRASVPVPRLRVRGGAAPHARGAHAARAQRRGVGPGVRPRRREARHRVAQRRGCHLGGADGRRARARARDGQARRLRGRVPRRRARDQEPREVVLEPTGARRGHGGLGAGPPRDRRGGGGGAAGGFGVRVGFAVPFGSGRRRGNFRNVGGNRVRGVGVPSRISLPSAHARGVVSRRLAAGDVRRALREGLVRANGSARRDDRSREFGSGSGHGDRGFLL